MESCLRVHASAGDIDLQTSFCAVWVGGDSVIRSFKCPRPGTRVIESQGEEFKFEYLQKRGLLHLSQVRMPPLNAHTHKTKDTVRAFCDDVCSYSTCI